MNHHPGKNLSLCLLYGCSHQEFSDISRPFLFFAVGYTSSAVCSGHNSATRKAALFLFVDQIEIHTPIGSAELRVANRTTGKTEVITFSKVAAPQENQGFLHSFPFLTIAYTSRPVFFGHILVIWKSIKKSPFEMPNCQHRRGRQPINVLKRLARIGSRVSPCVEG